MTLAATNYEEKFARSVVETCFDQLDDHSRDFIHQTAGAYRFTFQEIKQVCDAALDLQMWGEGTLDDLWELAPTGTEPKEKAFRRLRRRMDSLRAAAKTYPVTGLPRPAPPRLETAVRSSDRKVLGRCPVASEDTVCCNLLTLDAVENCGFGCSYCTIQSFYDDEVAFDTDLPAKLAALELDPDRFYHIGTGQSSDSLMWGNRHGLLDHLCDFARARPNVLLEFKTKSHNVAYFLRAEPPPNIVVSWSLNAPVIIDNEEHFTATLEQRLEAARQVADRGILVAFHFHPLVYYDDWQTDYRQVAEQMMTRFAPEEVAFVSFGTMTFIKPVLKAIRERAWASKVLQMELVPGAKGKLTYPDEIKRELFCHLYQVMETWHGRVFMYLCMETADLWLATFGRTYENNEAFAADLSRDVQAKLGGKNLSGY